MQRAKVKTTASVEHKHSPNPHHRAQLHAYLEGLSEKYEQNLTEGLLIYISRETLDMKPIVVEFDDKFWNDTVVQWASTHTEYRLDDQLPPAQPEYDWECNFCSYKERCGKGNSGYRDVGSEGFLPGVVSYPKAKVIEYLSAHNDARLTPILGEKYPTLARKYGVLAWQCPKCSETFEASEIVRDAEDGGHPICPQCAEKNTLTELTVPIGEKRES